MKRSLLIGSVMIFSLTAFSQNQHLQAIPSKRNVVEKFNQRNSFINAVEKTQNSNSQNPIGPVINPDNRSSSVQPINWSPISSSMNIYGVLEETSKPVQYNDELQAVSFIHRKSSTYQPIPYPNPIGAETGAIVGMVTSSWGAAWDSTCLWNNNLQYARYPQGAIYNPLGNKAIENTYLVACGPITQINSATGWIGSYTASKKLDVLHGTAYNGIASTVSNAQQFFQNIQPYSVVGKFDYPSFDFTASDDGIMHALGEIVNDFNSTMPLGRGFRGARVLKGTFNNGTGTFDWTGDSIIPPTIVTSNGAKAVTGVPHMAWNESGTVGYVWFIGCRQGESGPNRGFQPIVFKTINSGASWSLMNGIDFTDPTFKAPVLNHIPSVVGNPTLTIPLFNPTESMDGVVDKNDRLHIVSTVIGTSRSHNDSLGFSFSFHNSADGEDYTFAHVNGQRPYIYDFYQTATGWSVALVDSMSSEAPGERPGDDGFSFNKWDATGGSANTDKVRSNASIQVSRTPDGKFLVYTWAESDTVFTDNRVKWNQYPNVKARLMDVTTATIHSVEINLTGPTISPNPFVDSRAFMHHSSPKCEYAPSNSVAVNGPILILPITVSNNQSLPLTQLTSNTHWYASAELGFGLIPNGIQEQQLSNLQASVLFPNPANQLTNLKVILNTNEKIELRITNALGQVVKTDQLSGQIGENVFPIFLNGMTKGLYMVQVKAGANLSTKKLMVE